MRSRSLFVIALLCLMATVPLRADDRPAPPPAKDAMAWPALDNHKDEQVVIAAEPFDTAEKCRIFRVDYLKYHFMPIRIIVTNNSDRPISLSDARINFFSSANDKILAAEPDDVDRRVSLKDKKGHDIPIGPVRLHTKGKNTDNKIEQDFDEFEYSALAVEPHTTHSGFLFYDMDGLGSTPLRGAKLVLRELRDADGKELFYFEIPFNKYLNAQH
ncbi:hypothetical protein [Paracidobacterium acidisoli]|uniref:DUF4352 domain-containing protein n=1 Tax=Paracidobacterium acidisoli TaxID=2303751 RepID=A0A372IJN8_9BACT|nr:hypothetical protein [Paracidobacterium acidisoli]MBT9333193.1 hypothetical protein [Paracidobacterium acidisoli]